MTNTNSSNSVRASGELTTLERQVLSLMRAGKSTREIAEDVGITRVAVRKLQTSADRKLGILAPRPRGGDAITPREHDILRLVAAGHSTAEIARERGIATATVKTHVTSIYRKIGAKNRVQAARHYLDHLAPRAG